MSTFLSSLNSPSQAANHNDNQKTNLNQATISSTSTASTSSSSAGSSSNTDGSLNIANVGSDTTPIQAHKSSPKINNNHWSQKLHESVLTSRLIDLDEFLRCINGGSENGNFIFIDSVINDLNLSYLKGKINPNEILLEVQNQRISGYTLYDVIKLIKQLSASFESLSFRTVQFSPSDSSNNNEKSVSKNNSNIMILPLELRTYLDERFQKGSIDYDLQQTIRENVYMRTVPCTTRAPRNGEIDGQDYIFLTNDQFLELEQNGELLEYGVYNGHYYGTPKPPKEFLKLQEKENHDYNHQPKRNSSIADMNKSTKISLDQDSKSDSLGKYIRCDDNNLNDDKIDSNTVNNLENINKNYNNSEEKLNGNNSIINNISYNKNSNANEALEILPYGWEKVDDPEYGTFYIDHINKQTTYENPFKPQSNIDINTDPKNSSLKTFKPTQEQILNHQSNNNTSHFNSINNDESENISKNNLNNNLARRNIFFTQNPLELKGEFLKTSLLKTSNGFGFTIIGANETSEDFLQIKFIVPDGAAYKDGKLCQGDVLVYVNNECVLGYTHQDVVEIFQSIPVGNYVDLTVCRGYPLSIDPNDPNIEIMPLAAINNPENKNKIQAPLAVVDELTASTLINSTSSNSNMKHASTQNLQQQQLTNDYDEYYCEEYEEMYASIIKGTKGFGFTIADDSQMNQQKVKQILDKERCVNLNENDILLEINGIDLRYLTHNQVVEVLKECPRGKETIIKLKRRKYQITLPKVPNSSVLNVNNLNQNHAPFFNEKNSTDVNPLINNFENIKLNSSSEQTSHNGKLSSNLATENGNFQNIDSTDKKIECLENNDISTLKNNFHSNPKKISLQQDYNFSSNQLAFNNERRSKTPNILQSNSSNIINGNNVFNIKNNPSLQLRSKTPTTDRVLFQNNLVSDFDNEYSYINNNKSNPNINSKDLGTEFNSDVNKSTINIYQLDQKGKVNNNDTYINENTKNKLHIPIYDSTTNIQHQRVLKNLNKFNNLNNKSNNLSQSINNRSKTPGPETIYFRNNNNNQFSKSVTISSASNSNNQSSYMNRSKTPTADIMYYPSSRYNNSNNLFDNIYQPFNMNNQPNNYINDYNSDETFLNLLHSTYGNKDPQQKFQGFFNNNQVSISSDVDGNHYLELITELNRQESGFGFRIVGGEEEGSQVAIGYIVQGGAAHLDNVLRPNDEIIMIDNECVLGATHRRVVQLMTIAGLNRKVKLMVRRKITNQQYQLFQNFNNRQNEIYQQEQIKMQQKNIRNSNMLNVTNINNISPNSSSLNGNSSNGVNYPYTITLFRNGSEGFGFVIISTLNKNGPSIGKIVEDSPAERCKRLNVGDRILAVNGINITQMNHLEIVKLIKESGNSITLTIGAPYIDDVTYNQTAPSQSLTTPFIINGYNTINSQNSVKPSFNIPNMSPNLNQQNSPQFQTRSFINQNEYHVIELRKNLSAGFGFSIRGGREFNIPLFVLKLADNGPAALDGRLQVGDQILEINGFDAYNMSHNEAIERIKKSGNLVTLLIRRTGQPPPTIDEIIAVNSINSNISNNDQINQQSQLRSKSPFLTQHVKQFNSSGALINRNF